MSWICDGKFIKDSIADLGQDVIIKVLSDDSFNKWGDATTTSTDTTIRALVYTISATDAFERGGEVETGDVIMSVPGEYSSIVKPGNDAVVSGERYHITRVVAYKPGNITYMLEATLRKL